MALDEFVARHRERLEEQLSQSLPPADAFPRRIHEAIRYAALGGGKRLRPLLVLATAEAVGGAPGDLLEAACAVELIHASTLVLDDLPSMDDAELRRGKQATHRVFGESVAILAAIALLVQSYDLVTRNATMLRVDRQVLAEVIQEMSRATGSVGLVGGQHLDLELGGGEVDLKALESIHSRKTGQLFVLAATMGPMLSGGSAAELDALRRYAKNLGLAYQVVDDLLDRESTPEVLGKDVGKDHGKTTFATLLSAGEAERLARELVDTACGCIEVFGRKGEVLVELAQSSVARKF